MSNPTTPFSWQMPTATDLVTDLPADFEVFGQAVATSMADLLGGTTGQVLSKTTNADMDFTWIANDQGDITGVTAGTGITVTSPTGPVPTVSIDTATTVDKTTSQTLTNKTLTSPVLTTPSISNINAKGDILVGTADNTLGIITVGNNGETLVANSAAASGLQYNSNFAAGKNKFINGAFDVWQRGTSFASPSGTYTADRWLVSISGGSAGTASQQTFTPGTAPVAGYEGQYYLRLASNAGATYLELSQRIEDVRTFAGQTITLSFWAKATTSVTFTPLLRQNFGSGGSANVDTNGSVQAIASASWTRYTVSVAIPSISGKTIGTSSYLGLFLYSSAGTTASNTVEFWGVQLEAGSVATAFNTATGTLGGELSLCSRYFNRLQPSSAYNGAFGVGYSNTTTAARVQLSGFNTTMRTVPSITFSTVSNFVILNAAGNQVATALSSLNVLTNAATVTVTTGAASQTSGQGVLFSDNGTTAATIDLSAEL